MEFHPMNQGKVVQIIGAVVDVEFPRDAVPKVFDALSIDGMAITLEVQQQLGDGVVRTIALGSTDGLKRGLVANNTGEGIKVPVGKATLGRIMDVLGNPIDEAGPIGEKERWVIHRKAPSYDDQSSSNDLLETGIKVIDLVCRSPRAARSACSAAPASARPSTCLNSSTTSPPSTPACRCSPAWASAPAKATTSTTR